MQHSEEGTRGIKQRIERGVEREPGVKIPRAGEETRGRVEVPEWEDAEARLSGGDGVWGRSGSAEPRIVDEV